MLNHAGFVGESGLAGLAGRELGFTIMEALTQEKVGLGQHPLSEEMMAAARPACPAR